MCEWCGADKRSECDCDDRITCKAAGEVGHLSCGWCEKCDGPELVCGCRVKRFNEAARQSARV
jgi:hypothetical protein